MRSFPSASVGAGGGTTSDVISVSGTSKQENPQSGSQLTAAQGVHVSARFPHWRHLLRHADFDRIYRQGQRHFSGHMTVFYMPGAATSPRIGFTVGRMLGGAVERNRIRRRLREAVRLQLGALSAPVDLVINPKKSARTADFAELRKEIARAFQVVTQRTGTMRKSE